jgi:parallel beta helix pectate lyase-like protein
VNSQVEVDSIEIAGAGVGMEIRGERSPMVQSASIHDSTGEGILIDGPSAPWLLHNNIQRNGRAGVAARDGAHPALVGNVFEKNPVELGPDVPMDTVRGMNFFLDAKPARGGKKR